MTDIFMGHGRTYTQGRSTAGWVRGERVRSLDQLDDGQVFISVSHTFQSENLAVVIEQRPMLPGVWAKWALPDGSPYGTHPFSIHDFVLAEKFHSREEYFLAERETGSIDDDRYRVLAKGLVRHNERRRYHSAQIAEDHDTDPPLLINFAANTKVIREDDDSGAFVTCSIWVPNPNVSPE